MSCNTPIITFKQHNQWARGEHPIFFGNSGELAEEFTPESLADAIHKIIENPQNYKPRYNYLKYCGRKNFVNNLIKHIPYYRENIPEYKDGELLEESLIRHEIYQPQNGLVVEGVETPPENLKPIESDVVINR